MSNQHAALFAYVDSTAAETPIPLNDDDVTEAPHESRAFYKAFWANAVRVAAETQPDEGVVLNDEETDDREAEAEAAYDRSVCR